MDVAAEMSSIPLPTTDPACADAKPEPIRMGIGFSLPPGGAPSEGDISDAALVGRLRSGEGAAGETLVRRYYQPLIRYLQRLVSSEQVAQEMHQQTWLSVLEHLD